MKEFNTNWSKEELKIYTLIFCANADFTESKVETDFIKSKISTSDFDKIHAEYEKDNDYQSIQKIKTSYERCGYSNNETGRLLNEIKQLFLADDKYDVLEQNLFRGLNHIFQ